MQDGSPTAMIVFCVNWLSPTEKRSVESKCIGWDRCAADKRKSILPWRAFPERHAAGAASQMLAYLREIWLFYSTCEHQTYKSFIMRGISPSMCKALLKR
jgi:hypothetical protein